MSGGAGTVPPAVSRSFWNDGPGLLVELAEPAIRLSPRHAVHASEGRPFAAGGFHVLMEKDAVHKGHVEERAISLTRTASGNAAAQLKVRPARIVFDLAELFDDRTGECLCAAPPGSFRSIPDVHVCCASFRRTRSRRPMTRKGPGNLSVAEAPECVIDSVFAVSVPRSATGACTTGTQAGRGGAGRVSQQRPSACARQLSGRLPRRGIQTHHAPSVPAWSPCHRRT